ncbi:E3 binding domain-containing protein [Mycoplasma capricolum subsp. capricolum]|uniref:Mbov_0396 family ICE element transmembrane protein n=1 Tax=Mycoplasma capricolum TaxID=2095 RepID=UPI003DA603FB
MFKAIGDFIKGLFLLPDIIKNPISYILWWILIPITAIPATLAVIVEFFARDLVKLLIFGGDEFDLNKLPQAFKTIGIIAGFIAFVSFIFFIAFMLINSESRKQIKQSIKGIFLATLFVTTMPMIFFLLQYSVTYLFDLIKLAFGLQNESVSETMVKKIVQTGEFKPLKEGMKYSDIGISLGAEGIVEWMKYVNPIYPIITAILTTWTFIQFSIAIMQKSMELFTLFITSPIYAATAIFDNKKIFKRYIREKIIGKSFAILGLMFIWNVSFLFLNYFTNRLLDPIVAAIASSGKTGQVSNFGSGLIKGLVTLIAVVSSATFVSKGANLLGDLTGESINVSSPTAVFKLAGKVAGAGAVAGFAAFKKRRQNKLQNSSNSTESSNASTTSESFSSSNNSTITSQSITDKVNKSKTPSSNTNTILKGESSIAAVNQQRIETSKSSSSSSTDSIRTATISRIKTPPKSYKQTEELAKANKVDLSTITGSGQNGRILKSDVNNAINQQKELKTLKAAGSPDSSDDNTFISQLAKNNSNNSIIDKLEPKDSKVSKKQANKKQDDEEEKKKTALDKFKKSYKSISEIQDRKVMIQELKKLNQSISNFTKQLKQTKKEQTIESKTKDKKAGVFNSKKKQLN